MTKLARFLLAWVGVLLLAIGVLVGQQMQRSKFDKYLKLGPRMDVEWSLLETNLQLVREMVPIESVGVPIVTYDIKGKCFLGAAGVSPEFMKQSLEDVRLKLLINALMTRATVKASFPEMSEMRENSPDPDFRMRFRTINSAGDHEVVAEYADGKIVFK